MKISSATQSWRSVSYLTFELLLLTSDCFYFTPLKPQILFVALLNVSCCFRTMFPFMLWPLSGMMFSPTLPTYHFPKLNSFTTSRKCSLMPSPFFPSYNLHTLPLFHSSCLIAMICLSSRLPYLIMNLFVILVIFCLHILVYSGRSKNACWIDWMPRLQVSQKTLRSLSV